MRLGILLTAGPEDAGVHTVQQLVQAALARGWEVALFLMADGVRAAASFSQLAREHPNLSLTWCAYNADQLGVAAVAAVKPGSQADWAQIVDWAERVLTFG